MQFDKFTVKSQEAVQGAQNLAQGKGHQEIQPEHLMRVLLDQPDGVVVPILQKMGVNPGLLRQEMDELLSKLPQVSGGGYTQAYAGKRFQALLDRAFKVAGEMQDEYVSLEHLILAVLDDKDSPAAQAFKRKGVSREAFLQALEIGRASCRERVFRTV